MCSQPKRLQLAPQNSCPLARAWPADAGQTARLDGRLDGWKVMQEAAGSGRPAHKARIGALPTGLAARSCQHATPSRPSRGGCLLPAWQQGAAPVHDAANSFCPSPRALHTPHRTFQHNTTPTPFPFCCCRPPAMFSDCLAAPGSPAPFHARFRQHYAFRCARRAVAAQQLYPSIARPARSQNPSLTFRTAVASA